MFDRVAYATMTDVSAPPRISQDPVEGPAELPEIAASQCLPRLRRPAPAGPDPHSVAISISSRQWSLGPHSSTLLRARTLTLSWKPREAMA